MASEGEENSITEDCMYTVSAVLSEDEESTQLLGEPEHHEESTQHPKDEESTQRLEKPERHEKSTQHPEEQATKKRKRHEESAAEPIPPPVPEHLLRLVDPDPPPGFVAMMTGIGGGRYVWTYHKNLKYRPEQESAGRGLNMDPQPSAAAGNASPSQDSASASSEV